MRLNALAQRRQGNARLQQRLLALLNDPARNLAAIASARVSVNDDNPAETITVAVKRHEQIHIGSFPAGQQAAIRAAIAVAVTNNRQATYAYQEDPAYSFDVRQDGSVVAFTFYTPR
jgi:hypothetical protein